MGTLVIEDVEATLLDDLVEQAARQHVSVEQLAKRLLRQSVHISDAARRVATADAIAAKTPKGVVQTDSVELLRQDRNR